MKGSETMKRFEDWRGRFEDTIDEIKALPFVWGAHDCWYGLAGRVVQALTGADITARWQTFRYDSEATAYERLAEAGFDDAADLMADCLVEIHPAEAGIGDIVAIPADSPLKHGFGVVNGERVFLLHERGVGTVDLLTATRAFKVG